MSNSWPSEAIGSNLSINQDRDFYMDEGEPPATDGGFTSSSGCSTAGDAPVATHTGKHLRHLNDTPLSSPSRDRSKRPKMKGIISDSESEAGKRKFFF